ncbi:MAG: leucyl aminopeptidase [Bacteroidota bacterium]
MDVSLVRQLPELHKNTLLVVFLSAELLQTGKDLLPAGLIENESDLPEDEKRLASFQGNPLLLVGIGAETSLEKWRLLAHTALRDANSMGAERLLLVSAEMLQQPDTLFAVAESLHLSDYRFDVYKSDVKPASLTSALLLSAHSEADNIIEKARIVAEACCEARNLVNEPLSTLTAEAFSERMLQLGGNSGYKTETFHLAKIESLKMGGLLAVNRGSEDPPTFNILEHQPANPRNAKPIVLVGKGVVYDTGGLSLKPTANSMDFMKSDMGGAAAVVGTMSAIARLDLDLHVIGLIPATDNRPGRNAYVPGDVITMYDGSTVEVLNTDAEGRMILADALAYAKQYDPELVIDLATLTGSAVVALGHQGIAMMSNASEKQKTALKDAGQRTHERLVEFPLWDEYADNLRSDIADRKNIGGRYADAINAAKFLQHFTDYPWMHLDIAGVAWLPAPASYRGKNGTGAGVRLLVDFLDNYQA